MYLPEYFYLEHVVKLGLGTPAAESHSEADRQDCGTNILPRGVNYRQCNFLVDRHSSASASAFSCFHLVSIVVVVVVDNWVWVWENPSWERLVKDFAVVFCVLWSF